MSGGRDFRVAVVEAENVTPTIRRLRMVRCDGETLPPYAAGAHTVLTLETPAGKLRNPYSLLASTLAGGAYEIAVLQTPQSRGGSAFIHGAVDVGTELTLSMPVNLFPMHHLARRHVLVAGGIGITPIAAMAAELSALNAPFELHYAVRDEALGAFAGELAVRHGAKLRLYVSRRQERLAVHEILKHQPLGTHLYVCGPERMIEAVLADARGAGWPEGSLHAERFLAPAGGEPFAVRLARSGLTATVGEHQSLLEAIEAAGVDAPFLCRGGACGQCETAVVSADGTLLHHDHFLSEAEKASGSKIMTCVSRLAGRELVLDL
jgi:ferredoxin-NADP reductase